MISVRSKSELVKIRKAGLIVAKTLEFLKRKIKPGITTEQLDTEAADFISKQGSKAAFFGYRVGLLEYPAHICTSVNEEVVHGIPSARMLRSGDIISIDVGVEHDGYFGDAAITFPVGKVSPEARRLINVTREALFKAINVACRGNHLSDVSYAVQDWVEQADFSVVREFVGHGIGEHLHEEPQIPNYGEPGKGVLLEPGMVLAIEPMVNAGTWKVELLEDGWTAVTKDRKLSAHFEHTICITESKAEILTVI
ncbi:MAG: type I methionyl aminopeptidase [Candidatus Omnitrophica bacterium]|nr:type I methionyl aminopeptidase [Candidatus Omnitrophota bacterium]